MEYNGILKVEKGLTLNNPTIESQGVKNRFYIDPLTGENVGESLGLWIEMHYKGEGDRTTHSRSYPVE